VVAAIVVLSTKPPLELAVQGLTNPPLGNEPVIPKVVFSPGP
jgi:hypothetical protein